MPNEVKAFKVMAEEDDGTWSLLYMASSQEDAYEWVDNYFQLNEDDDRCVVITPATDQTVSKMVN